MLYSSINAALFDKLQTLATSLGYELVRVQLTPGRRQGTLQIMADPICAEGEDRLLNVDDCAILSRAISPLLEVEDPIKGHYTLEVSSPGVDRPLTRLKDFAAYQGHWAKLEVSQPVRHEDNTLQSRFTGILQGVEGDTVLLEDEDRQELGLPFDSLKSAKLILTDALLDAMQEKYSPQQHQQPA